PNSATVTSTTGDPNPGNETGSTTTTVSALSADLSLTKTDSPDPVALGGNITYTITVSNAGPDDASTVDWTDALPTGTTFVSLTPPGGWTCTDPGVGNNGTVDCSIASLAVGGPYTFTLVVNVPAGYAGTNPIPNSATVTSTTGDPNPGNETGTASTTVSALSADLSLTKTDTPDPVA